MSEKKSLDHADYNIAGTNIQNFSKWSRENIPKPDHQIPIGTLVEVKFDEWFGDGACWKVHARLWVVSHDRDCDGTPLYALSKHRDIDRHDKSTWAMGVLFCGYDEESLTPIEVTDAIREGSDALEWPERDAEI